MTEETKDQDYVSVNI